MKNNVKYLINMFVLLIFFVIIINTGCKDSDIESSIDIDIKGEWNFFLRFSSGLGQNQILLFSGTEEAGEVSIEDVIVGTYTVEMIVKDDKVVYDVDIIISKGDSYSYNITGVLSDERNMNGSFYMIENGVKLSGSWFAQR